MGEIWRRGGRRGQSLVKASCSNIVTAFFIWAKEHASQQSNYVQIGYKFLLKRVYCNRYLSIYIVIYISYQNIIQKWTFSIFNIHISLFMLLNYSLVVCFKINMATTELGFFLVLFCSQMNVNGKYNTILILEITVVKVFATKNTLIWYVFPSVRRLLLLPFQYCATLLINKA